MFTAHDLRAIASLWSQPSLVQRFLSDPSFLTDRVDYLVKYGVTARRWWNAIQHPTQEFSPDEKSLMLAIHAALLKQG